MQSREQLINIQQKLSIVDQIKEKKVYIILSLSTIMVLVGAVMFISRDNSSSVSVPKEEIITSNGLHWHPRLEVYIKGEKQEFTDSIGLGAIHQLMHTHKEDYKEGVVHMEMQGVITKDETKLKNFFRIWGKDFSSTQIFDKKNGEEGKVKMMVNGKENTDFENYMMKDDDQIVIKYE